MLTNFAIGTALLLSLTVAHAQQPVVPDETTKTRALKRAYQLNGNSMIGYGRTIDLSGGIPPDDAKCHMLEGAFSGQKFFECDQPGDKAGQVVDPNKVNEVDEQADLNMEDVRKFIRRHNQKILNYAKPERDVCTAHRMQKVYYGKSWRCRKI